MATSFDPTTLTGAALKDFNRIGGIPVNKFAKYKASGLLGNWGDGGVGVVSGANPIGTANTINATNLDFVRGGQETDPTYAAIQNLLNPNWGAQAYDSAQASAEDAAARGISGSNLANFRGARQYASDIRGNALAANQLLSGATSRLPTPYDPSRLITTPFESEQLAQQAALAREAQAAETERAWIAANSRGGGGGGRGAGQGGSVSRGAWPPPDTSGSGNYWGQSSFDTLPPGGGASSFPSTYSGEFYTPNFSPAGDQFGNQAWDTNTGTGSYDFGTGTFDTGGGTPFMQQDLFGASGGTGTIDSGGGGPPAEPSNYVDAPVTENWWDNIF
jgi:hypothetical protein